MLSLPRTALPRDAGSGNASKRASTGSASRTISRRYTIGCWESDADGRDPAAARAFPADPRMGVPLHPAVHAYRRLAAARALHRVCDRPVAVVANARAEAGRDPGVALDSVLGSATARAPAICGRSWLLAS